jgi:hypothetical protein
MDLNKFETEMQNVKCCGTRTVLEALQAPNLGTDQEMLDYIRYVMTDDSFKYERLLYLPICSALYKLMKNA